MYQAQNAVKNSTLMGKIPGEESGIEIKKTVCSICNPWTHCGINAYVKDGEVIKVEGSEENPNSGGTLCAKGAASRQYIYHPDRIRTPLLRKGDRGSGEFEPISWDRAMDMMTERFLEYKKTSGPESVVFFAGFSKWMRPFLKRLAHSFGSPNFCTESSTCATAMVLATVCNYGAVAVPDIPNTKCILVWSANPFYSNSPQARHFMDAKEHGVKIINVGPLITPMSKIADINLRMRPGTSGALALSFANVIIEEGLYDREFVDKWTHGFDEYRTYAKEFSPQTAETITGVPAESIVNAARLYATTKPAAFMFGASPTVHHTNGVQNHRAIAALMGLTGNFDRKGGNHVKMPSYYHVPNGLETLEEEFEQVVPWSDLPPRIGIDDYPLWSQVITEAHSMKLPHQIRSQKPYPVRAMLGFGLNYRMWPGSDFMKESLEKLDFLVDVDLFMTDTAKMADIVLPACSSFERSELKFYFQPYAMWTEPAIEPLGESRPDVDIIVDLAHRLNVDDPLLKQGYQACMDWIIEPAGIKIDDLKKHPGGCFLETLKPTPYLKYEKHGFNTPSGKMELSSNMLAGVGLPPLPVYQEPKMSPVSTPDVAETFPLVFTTGARLPMFIHSRTFRLPWTRKLRPDPMVDINPKDAAERSLSQGDVVSLSTPRGSIKVKANLTTVVPPGVVSMYHGYRDADVNLLIPEDYLDPISGFPGFKSLLCQVEKA